MVGGTWLAVPRLWSCGSTLGISLEQSFIQIATNGSLEPTSTNAAAAQNGGCLLHADVQEIKKGQ